MMSALIDEIQETSLQGGEANQDTSEDFDQDINRSLRSAAAHLHRYSSELASVSDTLVIIFRRHQEMTVSAPTRQAAAF